MFSDKCERAIKRAFKLMEECSPTYVIGKGFIESEDTKTFCKLRMSNRKNERFDVMFLNNQHQMIACETLFKGTIDAAAVYPRIIIEKVLEYGATALILMHNHPSGVSTPSNADIAITKRIQEVCDLISVRVLDHVIVGSNVYSFAEHGQM